jgi:hypothetical protein
MRELTLMRKWMTATVSSTGLVDCMWQSCRVCLWEMCVFEGHKVEVIDDEVLLHCREMLIRSLLNGAALMVTLICISPSLVALPQPLMHAFYF